VDRRAKSTPESPVRGPVSLPICKYFLSSYVFDLNPFLSYINLCVCPYNMAIIFRTCKRGFLDFVHRLYFSKITTFRRLDLFLSSGKKGRTNTLAVESPGCASIRPGFCPSFVLPEDGRRSSFRNVVILLKYGRWAKSKKPLLQIITHHRQNPLDFIYNF
jgi:hypothetical protein